MSIKSEVVEGYTKKYDVKILVYLEQHETMETAISREKTIKKWKREWKYNIIEKDNPKWENLYFEIIK